MQIGPALRRLWQHDAFRRLLGIRLFTQAADGTLQVGFAAYVLFSPQNQPNAWAVAGVLALTLMPFTILGPFVSPLLDKWSRRHVVVICDSIRASIALLVGILIFAGGTQGAWQVVLYGALLIALSVNRFVLAGLSAAMQHTVDPEEYLTASSILPTLGPLGVVLGFGIGASVRFGSGAFLTADQANGVVFFISAVMFAVSVLLARGFSARALGPSHAVPAKSFAEVLRELADAASHLRTRGPVTLSLGMMGGARLLFGLITVAVILASRNHFNDSPEAAMADLTLWGLLTGVGFIGATAFVPLVARPLGLRKAMIAFLALGVVAFVVIAIAPGKWVIFVMSTLVGLAVQSVKIATDTIVQAHVDESYKGRVFVFYDVIFNACFVLAAVVAALLLPDDGMSVVAFAGMGGLFLALGVIFTLSSQAMGPARFEKGTEDLTGRS